MIFSKKVQKFILASLFFLLFLTLTLFAVSRRQDIRKHAQAVSYTLSLYPTMEEFSINGNKTFQLIATFSSGSAAEKLDYFRTEIHFSKFNLQVPKNAYADVSASGFGKIFRVDGPKIANSTGTIIIELGAPAPGMGPSTDKPIVIAKLTFSGKTQTPVSPPKQITIGDTEAVNNFSERITFDANHKIETSYTVNSTVLSPTPGGAFANASSNQAIQNTIDAWRNGLMDAISMSRFINQLIRVSGLQIQPWNLCDPDNEVCQSTYEVAQ